MASVDQLARLFSAIAAEDLRAAEATATQIAETEARMGHHSAAQRLRGSLQPNAKKGWIAERGSPGATGTAALLTDALTLVSPTVPLKALQLSVAAHADIDRLILEWTHRSALEAANLPRRRRGLFHGPPGCGKSATAAALAGALALPCYVVRLDAVVGAYLGQTALHLRELFRFAETTPCVLLFDEFDALGKQRGDTRDVGELHRIAITLLQEFEHTRPAGYVIATSNMPTHLDAALWRRFDLAIEFARPSRRDLERYTTARAKALKVRVDRKLRNAALSTSSYAQAEQLIVAEARQVVLQRLQGAKNGRG
jgi:hypothetical protein